MSRNPKRIFKYIVSSDDEDDVTTPAARRVQSPSTSSFPLAPQAPPIPTKALASKDSIKGHAAIDEARAIPLASIFARTPKARAIPLATQSPPIPTKAIDEARDIPIAPQAPPIPTKALASKASIKGYAASNLAGCEPQAHASTDSHSGAVQEPQKPREVESTFTRVEALNTFLREEYVIDGFRFDPRVLKELLERWVQTVSVVMCEFSLYVNFTFQQIVRNNTGVFIRNYFGGLKDSSFLTFLYTVQGKGGTLRIPPRDGQYTWLRAAVNGLPQKYDCEYMTPIFQQAVNTFVVNLKNTIILNMPRHIAKFFRCFLDEEGRKYSSRAIKEQVAACFFPQFIVDPRLGVSFERLKFHPIEYIPFLFWLAEQLVIEDVKTFHVIPTPSYKMRHIHIPKSAIAQVHLAYCKLTKQRAEPEKTIRQNYRAYWEKYFSVQQFEREGTLNGNYFRDDFQGLLTDNVKACVLMMRTVWMRQRAIEEADIPCEKETRYQVERGRIPPHQHRVALFNSRKKPLPEYDQIIGADPGRKLTIGGVKIDVHTGKETNLKLPSRYVNDQIGYYSNMSKIESWSKAVMDPIRTAREAFGNIGPKSLDYIVYTLFELSHMMSRFAMEHDQKFRHLRFTAYCMKKSFYASYASELCPPNKTHLVFYGGVKFASFIRGFVIMLIFKDLFINNFSV
jgi:hypothetical protein